MPLNSHSSRSRFQWLVLAIALLGLLCGFWLGGSLYETRAMQASIRSVIGSSISPNTMLILSFVIRLAVAAIIMVVIYLLLPSDVSRTKGPTNGGTGAPRLQSFKLVCIATCLFLWSVAAVKHVKAFRNQT